MPQQIKLFGRTIPLPPLHHFRDFSSANPSCLEATALVSHNSSDEATASSHEYDSATQQPSHDADMESAGTKTGDDKHEETEDTKDEATAPPSSSGLNEMPTASSSDRATSPSHRSPNNGPQENLTSDNSQDRILKKPDKILPCPRCNSTGTKFCYYNNYNVNQPRHFCKNCQRYWTAGGTMRNVPVGAGRRKNKSSSGTHCRNMMVSEALRNSPAHNSSFGRSTTVLNFGADSPLCDSVASAWNLSDPKNGYHRPEQTTAVPGGRRANDGNDRLSGNSVTASSIAAQIPCYTGPTWPYQWAPTFCPSGFPVSFYPAPPYWGCAVPHPWSSVSPCSSPKSISPSSNHCPDGLSPTSPLGKHSREGNVLSSCSSKEPSRASNCSDTNSVLVPKTLRIDDPTEAAKSSIWVTLGISSDKSSTNGGGLFEGYESKNKDRSFSTEKQYSTVLQANPAALSRALNFHERN